MLPAERSDDLDFRDDYRHPFAALAEDVSDPGSNPAALPTRSSAPFTRPLRPLSECRPVEGGIT